MPDRGDLIEDLLLQYYDQYNFNGVLLVAQEEAVLYENSIGFADFESKIPLDAETPFYLASLGKQFTATAIMKLQEEGSLQVDQSVTLFLANLPEIYTEVKIYHLLNHTSGIPDYLNSEYASRVTTNEQVFQFLANIEKLEFKPGTKYRYSNSGYALLAMIIETVSGKSAEAYFSQQLFQPLGMTETFIFGPGSTDRKRAFGFNEKEKLDDYDLLTVGDGGFYSTASDLYKWVLALNNGEIISSASRAAMYKPVRLINGRERRYGYGWELGNNTAGPFVYHTGQLAGFRTYLERQNSTGTTIIILANNSFDKIPELRNQIVKILDGRITRITNN